jgi:hypothetical protein
LLTPNTVARSFLLQCSVGASATDTKVRETISDVAAHIGLPSTPRLIPKGAERLPCHTTRMTDKIACTQYGMREPPIPEDIDHQPVIEYEFVTFQEPHTMKSRTTQRVIRSHGARKFARDRRKRLAQAGTNFRPVVFKQIQQTPIEYFPNPKASSVSMDEMDPFQSLPVDSSRLQALITHSKSDA